MRHQRHPRNKISIRGYYYKPRDLSPLDYQWNDAYQEQTQSIMAANNQSNDVQENANSQSAENHEPVDFFEAEIVRYSASLEADPEDTYKRYGFTLYHSLPPGQLVLESQKLGFFRGDAADQYNLAGLEIEKENYEGAKDLLEKSMKMDDTLAETAYNLALCYEKLDRKADAIAMWNKFIELADEEQEEDIAPVEAHLAELQS